MAEAAGEAVGAEGLGEDEEDEAGSLFALLFGSVEDRYKFNTSLSVFFVFIKWANVLLFRGPLLSSSWL